MHNGGVNARVILSNQVSTASYAISSELSDSCDDERDAKPTFSSMVSAILIPDTI